MGGAGTTFTDSVVSANCSGFPLFDTRRLIGLEPAAGKVTVVFGPASSNTPLLARSQSQLSIRSDGSVSYDPKPTSHTVAPTSC